MTEHWLRIEDRRYANPTNEFGDSTGSHVAVELRRFEVLKITTYGVWLNVFGKRRFVLRLARKRFACPTLDEALDSFLARKRVQRSIFEKKIAGIEEAVFMAVHQFKRRDAA